MRVMWTLNVDVEVADLQFGLCAHGRIRVISPTGTQSLMCIESIIHYTRNSKEVSRERH